MPMPRSTLQNRLVPGLLLASGLALTAPDGVAAPLFAAPFLSFDAGLSSNSVAISDLNGDGKPDLVTANTGSGTVSVLLGHGDGTFEPNADYSTGVGPTSVAIGDLNGDGKPDLVVANHNTVSILLGNGDGSFQVKADYSAGSDPWSVAIGDLNGDSKPDLAVVNLGANTVSVLLGIGDGTFGVKTDYGTGSHPISVAIADLNGDTKPDLAVANASSNSVSVLLGNGDGTFGVKADYGTGSSPYSVAISDLNGDGKLDLVTADAGYNSANRYANTVSVLLGNGDGSFGVNTDYGAGSRPVSVAIADVNGDGNRDLAVANGDSNSVSVLLGNGDGTFAPRRDYGMRFYSTSVAIGDLNGDGRLDLVISDDQGTNGVSSVSVLIGNGDGTFGQGAAYDAGLEPVSVAISDLNRDGKQDLAVANYRSSTVSVLLGRGDGSFDGKVGYGVGDGPVSVAVGDLNGDGSPDIVVANANSNTVSVLLGIGDGTFRPRMDYGTASAPTSVAIGDLNGDGKPDLVTANAGLYPNYVGTVSVLPGNGDGTFAPRHDFSTSPLSSSVAIGDLNGDGKPDLVAGSRPPNFPSLPPGMVSVLLGNGDGSFGPNSEFDGGPEPAAVAIADLNRDGKPDLAVADFYYYRSTVSVLLGRGDGTFGQRSAYATGRNPFSIVIGDLNGDGMPDLASAEIDGRAVSVLLGNGDGTFGQRVDYGIGSDSRSLAIGDLNGDGKPDVAVVNTSSNTVSVLLNMGDGFPTPVALALVDAQASQNHVTLRWYGASMTGARATVFRQSAGAAWAAVARIAGDGTGTFRFEDLNVQPGARYGYRVGIQEGGAEQFYGETWISVPALALALEGLRPNPAEGEPVASFTLPNGSPARLELLDVTGRVWLTRGVGDLGAGSHLMGLGGPVPVGMYWLRLTQGGRSLLARGVVVR